MESNDMRGFLYKVKWKELRDTGRGLFWGDINYRKTCSI